MALKILTVSEKVSNRMRKEIDGFSAKIRREQINNFPCYLVDAVDGRCMMIECKDKEKLIQFYKRSGFDEIARVPDNAQPMVQMIKRI